MTIKSDVLFRMACFLWYAFACHRASTSNKLLHMRSEKGGNVLCAHRAGSRLWYLDQDDTTPSRDYEPLLNMLLIM